MLNQKRSLVVLIIAFAGLSLPSVSHAKAENSCKNGVLVWLSNTHKDSDHIAAGDAQRGKNEWLRDKIIGEPKRTEVFSSRSLKRIGMVGVYQCFIPPDSAFKKQGSDRDE